MAKIYFAVLNGARVVTALLDLENPPAGVTSEIVAHPWQQGVDIGHYLLEDMDRTLACLAELASDSLGPTSKEFFSQVASLWENLPPQVDGEPKDGFFGHVGDEVHFIRTSPEVALNLFRKLKALSR